MEVMSALHEERKIGPGNCLQIVCCCIVQNQHKDVSSVLRKRPMILILWPSHLEHDLSRLTRSYIKADKCHRSP
jgi:hypothetical protein